jgi:hypothetical protein
MSTRTPGDKGRPAREANNLTAIYEPIVYKMWEPQHFTTLWASSACYKDIFTFLNMEQEQLDATFGKAQNRGPLGFVGKLAAGCGPALIG